MISELFYFFGVVRGKSISNEFLTLFRKPVREHTCHALLPAAVDFYDHFCTRMENMMMLPGKDAISFEGP